MTGAPDTIVVFRIGSLGDTLVSLPAFHELRRRSPGARIVLLTNTPVDGGLKAAPSHQVLMGSGLIDDYLEYPHGRLTAAAVANLVRRLRALRPREVVYLMPPRTRAQRLRDWALFAVAGVTNVAGIGGGEANAHRRLADGTYEPEASRLLRAIGFGGVQLTPEHFSPELRDAERGEAEALLLAAGVTLPFIAVSVGAKVPAKDWGEPRWRELVAILAPEAGERALVFVGSADERERCDRLAALWPGPTLNLCGELAPRQSAAVLEKAAVFVGHDSGPLHLASSVGAPAVAVFAARTPRGVWFPFGNERNVFYQDVPCAGCGLGVCPNDMICLRTITAEAVAARVVTLLNQPNDF